MALAASRDQLDGAGGDAPDGGTGGAAQAGEPTEQRLMVMRRAAVGLALDTMSALSAPAAGPVPIRQNLFARHAHGSARRFRLSSVQVARAGHRHIRAATARTERLRSNEVNSVRADASI